MGDCCWANRPLIERLRNLCVTCLVLDSIFILVYTLTALSSMALSYKTACFEAHGYTWHNMIAFCYAVSALWAAVGTTVHGYISCNNKASRDQIQNVSRFANALVCWIFTAAVVEAVAYRNEPAQCTDSLYATDPAEAATGKPDESARAYAADSARHQDSSHVVWQLAYPLLWIAWVTATVAAAVLSKRLLQDLAIIRSQSNDEESGTAMPEIVGMPIQEPPSMQNMGGASPAAAPGPFGSTPGGPGGAGMITVSGTPCGPAGPAGSAIAGASPADPVGQAPSWQGGVPAGGPMVAQGRPVAGTVNDPEKAGNAPKQVD